MPVIVAVAALLAPPTAARADVLVQRPTPSIPCGSTIETGVWYRDFPTRRARGATIEVRSPAGALLWRRTVTATSEWRYFRFTPRCGRNYRVRYVTAAATTSFKVWVRKG